MKVTINKCLDWFQGSLIQLIPIMESAKIPWRDAEDLPDDFDLLSSALFSVFVIENIHNSQEFLDLKIPRIAEYASQSTNNDVSYIQVISHGKRKGRFHILSTGESPFDTVVVLNGNGSKESIKFSNCKFLLFSNEGSSIEELRVIL